jgi:WD40 repeat protein
MYAGMGDYRICIWDLADFSYVGSIEEGLWEIRSIFVDENHIYAASLNQTLSIYDKTTRKLKTSLNHDLGVTSVFVDNQNIYTTSYGPIARVWDKKSFKPVAELDGHLVRSMAITADDSFIYTGDGFTTQGASVRIWDKKEQILKLTLADPSSHRVNALLSDDQYLYSCHGGPGEFRIWEKPYFNLILTQTSSKGDMFRITANDQRLFLSSKDSLCIWNKNPFEQIAEIEETNLTINTIAIRGNSIYYGCRDVIKIRDTETLEIIKTIEVPRSK